MKLFAVKKFFLALIASIIAFFSPAKILFAITGFAVLCDMVTGIMKAKKQGEQISSRKLVNKIWDSILYFIGISLSFCVQHLIGDSLPIANIFTSAIVFVEFKSNMENIEAFTGIKISEKMKDVLSQLRK